MTRTASPEAPNHARHSGGDAFSLDKIAAGNPTPARGLKWESSRPQSKTVTAKRSPTHPPPSGGVGATGLMLTALSLLGKLSMLPAVTHCASPCGTPTSVRESSNRGSTAKLPTVFIGCESGSTSMFLAWVQTRGAAIDFAAVCMRLRGWTRSLCAGSRMGVCALQKSGDGLTCKREGETTIVERTVNVRGL